MSIPYWFSASSPGSQASHDLDQSLDILEPFVVLLFDDPVNTMQYVAAALREVLKVDGPTAESLMMEAHTTGKAAVFTGSRQESEQICTKLHAWTLHAKVVK